eukprot:CAMPEP_0179223742 /NCGR_PEP_ID=MMETSP0797-20121207/7404_1 /TAXON_ID=47934 /ORGANISM="Dinophysis acuminata, Strain DAEP01" /LENGTH=228 /DNA_ID=CAMNT_0020930647 /DNA_START=17 /DNA_END=700 /DNA_ORIENTATION=+
MAAASSKPPEGFVLVPGFVSREEEAALRDELLDERVPRLDKSHLKFSNTQQQEYGPRVSDAMELVQGAACSPLPVRCQALARRVVAEARRRGLAGAADLATEGRAFLRINHYFAEQGGYMHKHMDSVKAFGPVIACCSLLADAAMTFYDTKGNAFGLARVHGRAEVHVPRRSLYFMAGPARSQWQHGIRKDQCPNERLSLTFRTVRPDAPTAPAPTARRRASERSSQG